MPQIKGISFSQLQFGKFTLPQIVFKSLSTDPVQINNKVKVWSGSKYNLKRDSFLADILADTILNLGVERSKHKVVW